MIYDMESPVAARTRINGRWRDYFAGCSYLGLQSHPGLLEAAADALRRYGLGTATSRGGYGEHPLYREVEEAAAAYWEAERAVYYVTAYLGNAVLAQGLAGEYDRIFVDEAGHYSVWDGARTAGAPLHPFRHLDPADLAERLLPFLAGPLGTTVEALRQHPALPILTPLIQERLKTLDEAAALIDFAFVEEISYDPSMLVPKGLTPGQALEALTAAMAILAEVPFTEEGMDAPLRGLAETLGIKVGQLFGILRVATTGKNVAPPLFGCMIALGREKTLARCRRAGELLSQL
ncbi:MAG: aminotransferase class I/II-fold pyridoxal phosphate-dependent enzyme [Anaerolineae bacterium]